MDWVGYWDQDRLWAHSELWKANARLFLKRADPILKLKENDSVLNVGCGAGYLERHLAPRVKSILSVDTSERFVDLCRRNCRGLRNVMVERLGANYADLTQFGQRFSLFLSISVVQYYRGVEEVEALIRGAQKIALPGAQMLIADLPQERNIVGFARDLLSSTLLSFKEGYACAFLRFLASYALEGSDYRRFSKKSTILHFSDRHLQELIQRMGLDAHIIKETLSVCANRPSLLILF